MSVTSTVTFTNDISYSVQETLGGNVQRYNQSNGFSLLMNDGTGNFPTTSTSQVNTYIRNEFTVSGGSTVNVDFKAIDGTRLGATVTYALTNLKGLDGYSSTDNQSGYMLIMADQSNAFTNLFDGSGSSVYKLASLGSAMWSFAHSGIPVTNTNKVLTFHNPTAIDQTISLVTVGVDSGLVTDTAPPLP